MIIQSFLTRKVLCIKMTEHIELHSYCVNKNESDTEYQEITHNAIVETTFSPDNPERPTKEYNFFTQHDKPKKKSRRKKKAVRNEPSPNLMDIINSELDSMASPITSNIIMQINQNEVPESYLERTPRLQKMFQKNRPRRFDSEQGWRRSHSINLSPIFPKVLENATNKNPNFSVQYVEPIKFKDLVNEYAESDVKENPKFLDISIKNIKFLHHHDFSLEELLCVRLIEYFNSYVTIQKSIKATKGEIKVNRDTRNNLKEQFLKISSHKKEDLRFDQTILKYTEKLLSNKDDYYKKLKDEKEIIHKIISLWSDVQMIREKTGITQISYILDTSDTVLDEDQFRLEWMKVYEIEFSDTVDRIEFEYVKKYLKYKEIKSTSKRENTDRDKNPKPKLRIDEEKLKHQVRDLTNTIVSQTKINITLKKDDKIRTINNELRTELKLDHQFKVYVDNIFVCESELSSNTNYFHEIDFDESFSVQILPSNNTMTIVLNENRDDVSSINIDLSEIRHSSVSAEFVAQPFIYDKTVKATSRHVGSGNTIKDIASANNIRLKSSNLFKGTLNTACVVNLKIGWNVQLSANQQESIKSLMRVERHLQRLINGFDKPSLDTLLDLIHKIYGKGVEGDEKIVGVLKDAIKMNTKIDDTFPIDENSSEFVRLKLIHIRSNGGFTNIDRKSIPLYASQISTEQLNSLQKSSEKEVFVQNIMDKQTDMDPIDLQRFIGVKYVEKLNENLLKNLNEFLLRKTYKDVVRDFTDFSLRGLFTKQSNLSLRSRSSLVKQNLLEESLRKEQEIQVKVVRAFNLLDRSAAPLPEEGEDDYNDDIAGFKVKPLRPFVRVSYHGVSVQTPPGIGCHPCWNHTLKIKQRLSPLSSLHINVYDEYKTSPKEFNSEDERSMRSSVHYTFCNRFLGSLQIPLYSVLSAGMLQGIFKITTPPLLFGYESLLSKESKSVIPEVIRLMKKDTSYLTLHLTTSISNLGGFHEYTQPTPNGPEDDYIIKHLNTFVTDYLNDFPSRNISLTFIDSFGRNKCVSEFLQPIPLPDLECFPKDPKRIESALSKSSGVSKSSSSRSSRRKTSITSNPEGKESVSNDDMWRNDSHKIRGGENQTMKKMEAAMRYVSLIPTYEVTESHVVTLMGVELLKVLFGSPLDHTILLASYFLHLGIQCWVVTGLALPRGLTSYVLVKFDQSNRMVAVNDHSKSRGFLGRSDGSIWYIYDAVGGERYELRDVGCPLKTVNFVFDSENIWANVQSTQDCESVAFDYSRSSDWQPVFDSSVFVMKQPPVTDSALYSPPSDVERLRSALEAKIKYKIQKWRSHVKTIWNRYCSSVLREMLPHWEYWSFNSTESRPVPGQRLKQLMLTYKMFGYPLNMAYTSMKAAVSRVRACGAHVSDEPGVEFALAVDVFAYPNNVLSVWIFLATVTRI